MIQCLITKCYNNDIRGVSCNSGMYWQTSDSGRRKKMSNSTLFLSGLSRSTMCLNAESDDFNILSTPDTSPFLVTLMLSRLHENFVIVPADKASNNYRYTFVCKRYYVDILIEELGLHLLRGNPTYNLIDFSASEVLDNHKSVLTSFGIQTTDKELDLPYIYWIPKMHKNPYKNWFIAGSSKCSTKPLSILLTKLLTHIKQGLQKYCETSYSRSGVNQMWVLKNSKELLEHLQSPNFDNIKILRVKIDRNCNFVGLLHHPLWL